MLSTLFASQGNVDQPALGNAIFLVWHVCRFFGCVTEEFSDPVITSYVESCLDLLISEVTAMGCVAFLDYFHIASWVGSHVCVSIDKTVAVCFCIVLQKQLSFDFVKTMHTFTFPPNAPKMCWIALYLENVLPTKNQIFPILVGINLKLDIEIQR